MVRTSKVLVTIVTALALALGMLMQTLSAAGFATLEGKHAIYYTENVEFFAAAPGDTKQFIVGYTNVGADAWIKGATGQEARLGTAAPLGNTRDFDAGWAVNWLSSTRIAAQDDAIVLSQRVGFFIFNAKVPSSATAGKKQIFGRPIVDGAPAGSTITDGGWMEDYGYYQGFDVKLPPPPNRGRATGKVATQQGTPLTGVCVSAGVAGSCTWQSDPSGTWLSDDLPPGQWDFFFAKSGYVTQKVSVTLEGGLVTTVNVSLLPSQ